MLNDIIIRVILKCWSKVPIFVCLVDASLTTSRHPQAMLQPENAVKDYTTAINFLQGPGGDLADESELPTDL